LTEVDSIKELDFLYNSFVGWRENYPVGYYRVTSEDILRPDLISYKNYGTVAYWWLILFVNEIQDPFTDLEVGKVLRIPSTLDIYDFFRGYRLR